MSLKLNLDIILANNAFLTIVLGDFNAKSNLWYKNDKTTNKGSKLMAQPPKWIAPTHK